MTPELHAALTTWYEADRVLRQAIANESAARTALAALAFPTGKEGTENLPVGNGYILKGTFRINYSLDSNRVEEVFKPLPRQIAQSLVKWDAKLRAGAYKALEPAHKAIVNQVLTIKPGMPALELVQPKEP